MNNLYYCAGMPGAGKSTWLQENKDVLNFKIHSSDAIREEFGDINDQSKNELVFNTLHKRIKEDLLNGRNVAYDATNLKRKNRLHFLKQLNCDCTKICVLFATPIEYCKANNNERDRKVPEHVIERMIRNFEIPCKQEGWDEIQIVWWKYDSHQYNIAVDMPIWKLISHNNPHHSLSIGNHMINSLEHYQKAVPYSERDNVFALAVLLHDCGKPYVKDFKDSNGNITETAHYYQHHTVGAYFSLFYTHRNSALSDDEILYIALLIELHMRPFLSWKQSSKAEMKDRLLFGEDIIDKVIELHKYDLAAH